MKPQMCIRCEDHKVQGGKLLCFGCAQEELTEFELIDSAHANEAADWSNIQYGFAERSVRVRATVCR